MDGESRPHWPTWLLVQPFHDQTRSRVDTFGRRSDPSLPVESRRRQHRGTVFRLKRNPVSGVQDPDERRSDHRRSLIRRLRDDAETPPIRSSTTRRVDGRCR